MYYEDFCCCRCLVSCLLRKSRSCLMPMQMVLQRMHQLCTGRYWQMSREFLLLFCYSASVLPLCCVTVDVIVVVIKLLCEWQLQFLTIVLYFSDLQTVSPTIAFAHFC